MGIYALANVHEMNGDIEASAELLRSAVEKFGNPEAKLKLEGQQLVVKQLERKREAERQAEELR